ncbi:MAG: DUF402 domain-containing protein [Bacilli bacterium]
MENIKVGQKLIIRGYKHDGLVHRNWEEAIVLDVIDNILIVRSDKTLVINANGRRWRTKEPSIRYFYKDKWYNITAQLKKEGIFYKADIASPFLIDDGIVKYIDYDLDLKVFPDYSYRVLDRNEYKYHKDKLKYSSDIDKIVHFELDRLIQMLKNKEGPFKRGIIEYYNSLYKEKLVNKF